MGRRFVFLVRCLHASYRSFATNCLQSSRNTSIFVSKADIKLCLERTPGFVHVVSCLEGGTAVCSRSWCRPYFLRNRSILFSQNLVLEDSEILFLVYVEGAGSYAWCTPCPNYSGSVTIIGTLSTKQRKTGTFPLIIRHRSLLKLDVISLVKTLRLALQAIDVRAVSLVVYTTKIPRVCSSYRTRYRQGWGTFFIP